MAPFPTIAIRSGGLIVSRAGTAAGFALIVHRRSIRKPRNVRISGRARFSSTMLVIETPCDS